MGEPSQPPEPPSGAEPGAEDRHGETLLDAAPDAEDRHGATLVDAAPGAEDRHGETLLDGAPVSPDAAPVPPGPASGAVPPLGASAVTSMAAVTVGAAADDTLESDEDLEATLPSSQAVRPEQLEGGEVSPLVGLVLPGNFRVLRALGEGGFGTVYLAEQVGVGRMAVIKVLRQELVASPTLQARFEREAKVLASLGQDHLVQLYVADRLPSGQPFLAMEYGGDRTLQDELARAGRFPPARALAIAEQICDALEEAHGHDPKVVHRDLKPANVMLAEKAGRDWVKVVDVGMARLLGPSGSIEEALVTQQGALMGTPAYFSPEQARGDPADERSDLYALGCVLFEMLAGRLPFEARTPPQFIHAHCFDAPLSFEQVGVQAPAEVSRLVYRALEKDAADRFQTAAEMRAAIRAAQAALVVQAAAPPAPAPGPQVARPAVPADAATRPADRARERAPEAPPRRKRLWWAAAALALAAAGGLWLVRGGAPSLSEQDLARAHEAEAQKDFKAALVFARRAGTRGGPLSRRLVPEADAQDVHEKLLAALDARDADQALELGKRCKTSAAFYCGQVEGRQDEVRALYAKVHLGAARDQQAKSAWAACSAEASLVLAVDPADAAARALASDCAGRAKARTRALSAPLLPPPDPPRPQRPAPAPAPAAPSAPDARKADTAATRLVEQALGDASAGHFAKATERLLAAEALHPSPEVKLRVYRNLVNVAFRNGDQAQACRYVRLMLPLSRPKERAAVEGLAARCPEPEK